ncbi:MULTISPECIES: sulfite exporter TauE/SafE family protein [Acinetobacter]|uniref:Probable membrane transporter protein n=1 Tax=Acinetobacter faecalis TaxID=2665161 RepID=A0ABU5GLQ6_9GAMM|nr:MULTISPECIES: sulfite exporter TauE/SafE family protein [Acinetobacter]MDY6467082.1 sulfite exporter TauE/SafE family protein [Acinetobacter faecalis]MDY6481124.1 sulfite exporter TauE/SafE family protein [Acinetobacter faecalis]MDY6483503.1 sulfite exporter TauE/SafE family protein [Acinetobacter faecalis]MDY6489411.1 sulfite exporter TauE/SafE family protein [Acinetobacter faecalis]MDY6530361.1 sulfite exporter TauE/SafE family protein [Acinetobacter faecalis]
MELIIFLAIGALAGFAAGLFGVGGGTIIVPLLFIVFTQMDYSPDVIMHLALGTSLATIVVTSISSLMAHHKNGAVIWPVFKNLAPPMAIGCFLGAGLAGWLSGIQLQLIVGVFLIWVAYTMFVGAKKVQDSTKILPSSAKQIMAGSVIGGASAIFGIGGGSLTVPYLTRHGVVMQKAVGTSAACGLPIAITGALGFMIFGMNQQVNIPNTIGFVHIYAFFGISVMSFFTAKLGAKVAHALSPQILKKCFAVLLVIIGIFFLVKGLV